MSSQYFSPYVVGRSSNVKAVLNLSGYLRKDDKTLGTQNYLKFIIMRKIFEGTDYSSPIPLGVFNLLSLLGTSSQTFNTPDQKVDVSINETTRPFHVTLKGKNEFFIQSDGDGRYTGSVANIYIAYKISPKNITSTNALRNSLFAATRVSNTTTKDPQKYNYSGCGIAFS